MTADPLLTALFGPPNTQTSEADLTATYAEAATAPITVSEPLGHNADGWTPTAIGALTTLISQAPPAALLSLHRPADPDEAPGTTPGRDLLAPFLWAKAQSMLRHLRIHYTLPLTTPVLAATAWCWLHAWTALTTAPQTVDLDTILETDRPLGPHLQATYPDPMDYRHAWWTTGPLGPLAFTAGLTPPEAARFLLDTDGRPLPAAAVPDLPALTHTAALRGWIVPHPTPTALGLLGMTTGIPT